MSIYRIYIIMYIMLSMSKVFSQAAEDILQESTLFNAESLKVLKWREW